jgi:hypothetical protein
MKSSLASMFIAAAASLTAATVTTTPVRAEAEYAWCAHEASQNQSCSFTTLAQCKAYVDGPGGYCQSNPRASAFAEMPKRSLRR